MSAPRRTALLLLAAVALLAAALPAVARPPSSGGSFTAHRYTASDPLLSRDYYVYDPGKARGKLRPLVVYLHGCNQTGPDAAAGTQWNELAAARGFVVAYPEQSLPPDSSAPTTGGNGTRCWNWFEPEHQTREGGEPSTLAGITREVIARHSVDPTRVYVLGASAGADMAVILGATYPDLYAAIGAVAGCPYLTCADATGAAAHAAMGEHARTVPVFALQGTADPLNNPAMGAALVEQWLGTSDLTDNGAADGSVSRQPAATRTETPPATVAPDPTAACVPDTNFPCPGGAAGLASYPYTVDTYVDGEGREVLESWLVHGLSHNYPGGDPSGSFTDPLGPDATEAAYAFFSRHTLG